MLKDFLKNTFLYGDKYQTHSEAVIITCFFNPQNSSYRLKAFQRFYNDVKHLNHRIIECVIGDAKPQLDENENIQRVYTDSLLWHKESLLNKIVSELPEKFKYVFWIDADVIFTNKNWMVDGVKQLQTNNFIQPFEYCVHLERDESTPSGKTDLQLNQVKSYAQINQSLNIKVADRRCWRSFCANFADKNGLADSENYDTHGHVGFAFGARREILNKVPLYDKALIGGGDHVHIHAAAGQIPCPCITKSFTENIDEINDWSSDFFNTIQGRIGYVKGDLYHLWHGDIDKRQYLKRIQDFNTTSNKITKRDKNGLYINYNDDSYIRYYFSQREVSDDDSFLQSIALGYLAEELLFDDTQSTSIDDNTSVFDGGTFGGSGASGSWSDSNQSDNQTPQQDTPINNSVVDSAVNQNFS